MSPLVDINFDDTPDELPQIPVGVQILTVKDAELKTDTDKEGNDREFIAVELELEHSDAELQGLRSFERFYLGYPIARVNFKRFCKSAGHSGTGAGVDLTDLIGCSVKAAVKSNSYTDKETGETVENTRIREFIVE